MLNKKTAFTMILLMAMVAAIILNAFQTNAQEPLYVTTYLHVWVSPNPVGVGQTAYISLFFTKPLPPSYGTAWGGGVYHNLTLVITDPDGNRQTLGPYTTDTTGGVGGISIVPSKVGTYTVQANYPGELLPGSTNIYLKSATSDEVTFTVQETPVPGYSSPPLPTEYWSRPIYATNYAWAQLGGNWWGLGRPPFMNTGGYDASGNNFNAYSPAPNSAHIMWTRPVSFGGQVGAPINADQESQYTSTSILYQQFEPVILNGILYYDHYPNIPAVRPGRIAVDIRTGQTLWTSNVTDTLAFGAVLKFHTIQEYGTQAWLWAMAREGSTYLYKLYDPMTGTFVANVTGLPSSLVGIFGASPAGLVDISQDGPQGTVLIHWVESGNLTMWNSTLCLMSSPTAATIRPSGNINFSRGIQWRVPLPTTLGGATISPAFSIAAKTNEAILLTSYAAVIPTFAVEFGESYAIDIAYDTKTGQLLWGPINRTLVRFNEINIVAAGEGYYVRHDKDMNQAYGYSLTNGQQLWGPVQLEGNALSTLARGAAIAYGKVYIWDFGGYVNAIDLQTGKVAWTFHRGSAGYENPYGVYPIWHYGSQSIADGKLFLSEGRMYDPPLFPNARRLAINCTTGELVWSVLGFYARNTGAIADGFLLSYNSYDAQIYCFGKGPSKITVTASPKISVHGSRVLVEGMVTDESPGTKHSDRVARFPQGVPAVSDESMSAWMEYVYMQQPKPTNVKGVEVTVTVLDPNNNCYDVGKATSDADGMFRCVFTPPVPGEYTIIATFSGSESYWPSHAVTSIYVEDAPPASPEPTPPPASLADLYFLPMSIATIAIVVIVLILLILLLKKK